MFSEETKKRFWDKVGVKGEDECWEWTIGKFDSGYGAFSILGKMWRAHRVSWIITYGEISGGLCVLHTCDNPDCVNPNHLFLGTHQDNTTDMIRKGRQARGDSHGSRLHPERLARGDRHGSKTHPESRPRGDKHSSRLHPEVCPRGENNGRAKLTEDDVRAIRENFGGMTQRGLAKCYGVSHGVIGSVQRRKTWRHVS